MIGLDFKNLKNKLGFTETPIVLRVTMMGGRGAGKSSVLASLAHNMQAVLENTDLYMNADAVTKDVITGKFHELTRMFDNVKEGLDIPAAGIPGDEDVSTYAFKFGMNNTASSMDVVFRDFPGEFVEREPLQVKNYIEESNAVLIAIDTPHLMEEDGAYNEAKNCCTIITDFILDHLKETVSRKLILLVPLKCEKYYHAGQMADVADKVEQAYSELIEMLKRDHMTDVASAIIPIQTLGDVIFSHFGRDEQGQVKTVKKMNSQLLLPVETEYRYRNSEAHYAPMDCEQPLYYLLTFMAKEYERLRNEPPKTFMEILKKKIGGMFKLLSDNPEFLLQISRLKRKRKSVNREKGFVVLTGKNLI